VEIDIRWEFERMIKMRGSDKDISIFVSLILRHKPEVIGLKLDTYGYINVNELLEGINKTGRFIDIKLLQKIVTEDNKQRYKFNEDCTKIRANQGHSIKVNLELEDKIPPDVLYHGTASRFTGKILREGILKQSREYVHLSSNIDTAISVGKRHGNPIILKVNAKQMNTDGFKFKLSDNNVWLTDIVPIKYIVIM